MEQKKSIHHGHFKRLREQFLKAPDVYAEHQVLELILTFISVRRDVNPLAHTILAHCGSFEKVMNASKDELMNISGVTERTANFLVAFQNFFAIYEKSKTTVYRPMNSKNVIAENAKLLLDINKDNDVVVMALSEDMYLFGKKLIPAKIRKSDKYVRAVAHYGKGTETKDLVIVRKTDDNQYYPGIEDLIEVKRMYVALRGLGMRLSDYLVTSDNIIYSFKSNNLFDIIDAVLYKETNFFKSIIETEANKIMILKKASEIEDCDLDQDEKLIIASFRLGVKLLMTDIFD